MTQTRPPQPCPICDDPILPRRENKSYPFCSPRCKMEDLGKWLGGQYLVAGRPASPEEFASEFKKDQEH